MNTCGYEDSNVVDITVSAFHVGGRGGLGPTMVLLKLGESLSLTIFEANIEDSAGETTMHDFENLVKEYSRRYNVKLTIIPQCLSNCIGKKKFNVNVMPDCSSLLEMSPDAAKYQRMSGQGRIPWGQICRPTRTIELDVSTLDELNAKDIIPVPQFLSIDVQGAEYDVLEGASKALYGDLLGVVSEVEFRPLYDGQKLFVDQYALLNRHRFDLFELYNIEYWFSGPIIGKGALMVAEALFLRNFRYFVEKYNKRPELLLLNLAKLAVVATCFERSSYAFEIVDYIMSNWPNEWNIFVRQNQCRYLNFLGEFYIKAKAVEQRERHQVPTYVELMANKVPTQFVSCAST